MVEERAYILRERGLGFPGISMKSSVLRGDTTRVSIVFVSGIALGLDDLKGVRLRRPITESHDDDGRAGAKPEQTSPSARRCRNKRKTKDSGKEVADGVGREE
jgi:hypothetical protein